MFGMSEARKEGQEEIINVREGQVLYLGSWVQSELNNVRQEIREMRSDIKNQDASFHQRIDSLRQEVKQEINSLRQEVKQDISSLRQEVKQDISSLRQEIREDIASIRRDVSKLQYWAFGTFLSIVIATILHFFYR